MGTGEEKKEIYKQPPVSFDKFEKMDGARLSDQRVDNLIGLCEGIIADNNVSQKEAEFLKKWIENSKANRKEWPFNIIYTRLEKALKDGVLDNEESKDLLELLTKLTGGQEYEEHRHHNSTSLPLDDPPPDEIIFEKRIFVPTGKFFTGSRNEINSIIEKRNGEVKSSVSSNTNYLIIGGVGNPSWIHSTYGRKIEKAVQLRDELKKAMKRWRYPSKKQPIQIISEKHFVQFL